MTFIKMIGHEFAGRYVRYGTVELTSGELTVSVPMPLISLGGDLAITPEITLEGTELRVHLTQWKPLHFNYDGTLTVLPLTTPRQSAAVTAAHAFDGDPRIRWSSPPDELVAWCESYAARLNSTRAEKGR